MRQLWRDVLFGVRMLAKSPGFTAVALLALALGIGGNTAIFSVVYATLIEPLHYDDAHELVMVWPKPQPDQRNGASVGDFLEWRARSSVFKGIHAWSDRFVSLATTGRPRRVEAGFVTPGWILNHGLRLRAGRDFLPEEGTPGNDHVVVLTDSLWRETFGEDPGIVGKQLRIDGSPSTVTGVLRPGPADRMSRRLYVPLAFAPDQAQNFRFNWLTVMARLRPGVTLAQANAEMAVIAGRVAAAHPRERKGWTVSVEPLQNNFLPPETIRSLWLLLAAVAFVLLIACANVANLQLARGSTRQRELVVRAALGAGRRRLVRQLLTESLVLAVAGGALGIALAVGLLDVIAATMPPYTLPSEADVRLSVPVLLFTLAATTAAGVLFGCAPAWHATRLKPAETLKEGGRAAAGPGRSAVRRALVVVEFALALSLLTGGGLAVHSLIRLAHTDLGFRTERLLTFSLPVPDTRLADEAAVRSFYRRMLERIEAVPGVAAATVSTGIPVEGTSFGMAFDVVGQPVAQASERPGAGFNMVTPGYYGTFGLRMLSGRALDASDREGSLSVAVVNETFAKRYLAGLDPLAQRLRVERLVPGGGAASGSVEWQIVGVMRDVRNGGPRNEPFPQIDVPFWQSPWPSALVSVRSSVEPAGLGETLTAIVQSLDPELPVADMQTMDETVRQRLAGDRFSALLFGGFAAIALLLAAVGIYGVMSFVVAQRTQELGLRMALGAGRTQVLRLVMRQGMATAIAGSALGVAGSYWVGRTMQGMFPGVPTLDLPTFAAVALALLVAAFLACYLPARRAAGVDPLVAMRQE
jgi:putative ABC transport system permease protein